MFKLLKKYVGLREQVRNLTSHNSILEKEKELLQIQLKSKSESLTQLSLRVDKGTGELYCVFQAKENNEYYLHGVHSSEKGAELFIEEMQEVFPDKKYLYEHWTLRS